MVVAAAADDDDNIDPGLVTFVVFLVVPVDKRHTDAVVCNFENDVKFCIIGLVVVALDGDLLFFGCDDDDSVAFRLVCATDSIVVGMCDNLVKWDNPTTMLK